MVVKILSKDFIKKEALEKLLSENDVNYEMKINEDDLVADAIFQYLFQNKKGFLKNNIDDIPEKTLEFYKRNIRKQVDEGKPIEFFFNFFTPKFKYDHTNGLHIYPDFMDLHIIVHLHKIAKEIRRIYSYNFKFIIVFNGDLFKSIGMWSTAELNNTLSELNKMKEFSEDLTGALGSVDILRMDNFLDENSASYNEVLIKRSDVIYNHFKQYGDSDVSNWFYWFTEHFDLDNRDKYFIEYFEKQCSKIVSSERMLYEDGGFLNIINRGSKGRERFLAAQTKEDSKHYSIDLDLIFDRYDYFRVITRENGKWDIHKWQDISHLNPRPVFYRKFDYPIYFDLQRKKTT